MAATVTKRLKSAVFFVGLCCSAVPLLASPPEGWHAVDPGFSVQVLIGHGTAMWAAGSAESIAVSTDGGQHWTCKHENVTGSLLLTLRFVDGKFGYAAGTGGKLVVTQDGGETWTAQKVADETILQAAFGDPLHGVVRTISALLLTSDGGQSWRPVVPESDPDWVKRYPVTVGMVALDKNWMTVRVAAAPNAPSAGEFLWTGDGGATWKTSGIDNTRIYDLFVARGSIWAAGYERAEPMSFRQAGGAKWEHVPVNYEACHWPGCGGYTDQGYFAGKDFLVLTQDGKETMASFPTRQVLTSQWARSGERLCAVRGETIECAALQPMGKVEMNREMPGWEQAGFAGIGRLPRSNPQCLRCDLQSRYFAKTAAAGEVEVTISFMLDPLGHVTQSQVAGDVPEELAANIRRQMEGWFFEPLRRSGEPVAAHANLRVHIAIADPSSRRTIVIQASPAR